MKFEAEDITKLLTELGKYSSSERLAMILRFNVNPREDWCENNVERMRNASNIINACASLVDEVISNDLEVHCGNGLCEKKETVLVGNPSDLTEFMKNFQKNTSPVAQVSLAQIELKAPTPDVLCSDDMKAKVLTIKAVNRPVSVHTETSAHHVLLAQEQ